MPSIMIVNLNLYGQLMNPKLSIGILSSDIHESTPNRASEERRNSNNNDSKIGFYTTISSGVKCNNWLSIEFGVSYQERLPLEKFTFINQENTSGVNSIYSIVGYPTSPQSKSWNEALYRRFPNFKYAHLELIPTYSIGKKKSKVEIGFGVFYGYLLNQGELEFSIEDFPTYIMLYGQPANVTGVDRYNKHDIGWIPKIGFSHQITDRMTLGLSFKSYISQYGLKRENEHHYSESRWNRQLNTTWMVYAAGIDVMYDL